MLPGTAWCWLFTLNTQPSLPHNNTGPNNAQGTITKQKALIAKSPLTQSIPPFAASSSCSALSRSSAAYITSSSYPAPRGRLSPIGLDPSPDPSISTIATAPLPFHRHPQRKTSEKSPFKKSNDLEHPERSTFQPPFTASLCASTSLSPCLAALYLLSPETATAYYFFPVAVVRGCCMVDGCVLAEDFWSKAPATGVKSRNTPGA